MEEPQKNNLKYDWGLEIEPHLGTLEDVQGGFTPATRGIITLEDGSKVFVKIATDENTTLWLKKEIKSYEILNKVGYLYMPKLLAVDETKTAMAIDYLEDHVFEDAWDNDKLDAVLAAKEELNKYISYFDSNPEFMSDERIKADKRWGEILSGDNIQLINNKLVNLNVDLSFSESKIKEYIKLHEGWMMKEDSLIHQDIRYDNFGYNPKTKTGKLVDWNWLCIGDDSLDTTSLFVSMIKAGFNPYVHHPEKLDKKMLVFLIEFWLDQIRKGDENSSPRERRLRVHQAESLKICVGLVEG